MCGGGGGGGGTRTRNSSNRIYGGGGGAGEVKVEEFIDISSLNEITITIGAGGVGGLGVDGTLSSGNGGNGGPSSFGNLISCNGGGGGQSGDSNDKPLGGIGGDGSTLTTGVINNAYLVPELDGENAYINLRLDTIQMSNASPYISFSSGWSFLGNSKRIVAIGYTNTGVMSSELYDTLRLYPLHLPIDTTLSDINGQSGRGANTMFGRGGVTLSTDTVGKPGKYGGGGGAGAYRNVNGHSSDGGNGGDGIVVIEW